MHITLSADVSASTDHESSTSAYSHCQLSVTLIVCSNTTSTRQYDPRMLSSPSSLAQCYHRPRALTMLTPPRLQEGSRSKKTCHDNIHDIAVLPSQVIEIRSLPTSPYAPPVMEAAPTTDQPRAPNSRQRVNILQLPAETLLQIASLLRGSNAIIHLSRVNKSMHSVIREAMAKELIVHKSRFMMATEWLAF
jgi:hypothetical protein